MQRHETPERVRFRSWHVLLAAFVGAVANVLAFGALLGRWDGTWVLTLAFFLAGIPGVALIGLPVARHAFSHGRCSLRSGFAYGAMGGAFLGAALALLFFWGTLGDWEISRDWLSFGGMIATALTALLGAMYGVVNGAFAGAALAWCGQRQQTPS